MGRAVYVDLGRITDASAAECTICGGFLLISERGLLQASILHRAIFPTT